MDESATGSVNFFRLRRAYALMQPDAAARVLSRRDVFLWALGFAVFIWIGGIAVGLLRRALVHVGAVAGAAIFLYVRTYGEDDPTRP